jgi:DNA-binding LacI/PurR family transcriptional regulator
VDPRRRRATIEQVAKLAGVSTTTVSNVLNDRTDAMRPSTRQRVLEAAEMLGYHPSQVARSLANRQSATVGLVIAEIATPLFFNAVSVIERVAREGNYNVLLCHASTPDEESRALDLLQEKEVEGVVFLSTSDYRDDEALVRLADGIPVVTVNRSGSGGGFDRVTWDNVHGMSAAVRHLHALGHRRIGFLRGPAERQGSDERWQGYQLGLADCGLEYTPELVAMADYTAGPEDWRHGAEALLAVPLRPTAILASDDSVAAVVMKTLQERGLRVPDDMAVVGVDDQPFAPLLNPSLTTVKLPILEAGQKAIELLTDRLREGRTAPERVVLTMELIVRDSCGAMRAAAALDSADPALPV